MAANGQRIHPAGSQQCDPRHAASTAGTPLDPSHEHDACGVGFIAAASGARTHQVVEMAIEAVARVAHRGAASTDNSGDGAGLLTQIPYRLFYRDSYRLGLHLQPGLPFGVGTIFLPRESEPLTASIAMIESVLAPCWSCGGATHTHSTVVNVDSCWPPRRTTTQRCSCAIERKPAKTRAA